MRDVTAMIGELNRIASHLDNIGHYTEADYLDDIAVKLAQSRKKRTNPFAKALMYGVPAMLAGQALMTPAYDSNREPVKITTEFVQPAAKAPEPIRKETSKPIAPQQATKPAPAKQVKPNRGDLKKFKQFTLPAEGGFVHRKKSADPGGATNMGVTQNTYNQWRDSMDLPRQSVRKMTPNEAHKIMEKMYWNPIRGNELPERTAVALADWGYHGGTTRAIRLLQRIVGAPQTGVLGPATMKLTWEYASTPEKDQELAIKITNLREAYLKTRPHAKANPGWFNRTEDLRDFVQDQENFPDPNPNDDNQKS
jgi:lysozyme family protein